MTDASPSMSATAAGSDGFEIGCDNGERVRVAFALDCCNREAMSFLAFTSGVSGEDVSAHSGLQY